MALESLKLFEFSKFSDTWSFGVLLHQIYSLEEPLYKNVQLYEIVDFLTAGKRLPKPELATDEMYNLMRECWNEIPNLRPSFLEIKERLVSFIEDTSDANGYLELSIDYGHMYQELSALMQKAPTPQGPTVKENNALVSEDSIETYKNDDVKALQMKELRENAVKIENKLEKVKDKENKMFKNNSCEIKNATSFAIDKSVESRMKIEKIDENFCFVKTKSTNFPNIIIKLIQHNYIPIISTLDITKLPLVGTNFEWSKAIFIVNSKYIKDPNYLNNAISKFYPSEIEEIKRYGKIMLAWNTRHPQIIAFNIVQFLELFSTGFNEKRLSKTIPLYPSDTNYFNKAKQNFKHYHDKYSVIILTYSRNELLLKLLQRFNEFNDVDKILVIWNNQNETSIPEKSFWANITSDVYFVKTNSNSLNNRFLPYDILRTEAILSLDDDQTLHPNQLNHAFGAWRLNKDVLVGSYPRLTQTNTSFSYHKTPIKGYYDLILTGHAFFHIKYLHIYSNQLPNEIKRWVDSNTNGEDISMNFIIAFFSNKPNIKFLEFRELSKKCSTCKHAANISSKKDHYKNRSKILNLLYNTFAINPLIQTKYILNFMS
uniref:Protein kinase domain-containing protein n=1 Tax=Rhabditophanes sp. KR3021 TaxID=114890 RepID=A0AC35UH35_9BILA